MPFMQSSVKNPAWPLGTCTSELLFQKTDSFLGWESSGPLGSRPACLGLSFHLCSSGVGCSAPKASFSSHAPARRFRAARSAPPPGEGTLLLQHQGQGPRADRAGARSLPSKPGRSAGWGSGTRGRSGGAVCAGGAVGAEERPGDGARPVPAAASQILRQEAAGGCCKSGPLARSDLRRPVPEAR